MKDSMRSAMSSSRSPLARRRPSALFLFGSIIVSTLASTIAVANRYDDACRRWSPTSAIRWSTFLRRAPEIARSCSECSLSSAVTRDDVDLSRHSGIMLAQLQSITNNGAIRPDGGGVLESISRWQACFTRGHIPDVDAVVAACDLIANSPDLPEPTREWVARRRLMLLEFKTRMQEKSERERNAPSETRF
jgi:hypothetical protein